MNRSVRWAVILMGCLVLAGIAVAVRSQAGHDAGRAVSSSSQPRTLVAETQPPPANPKAQLRGAPLPPLRPGEVREPAVGADMMPPTARQASAAKLSANAALAAATSKAPLPGLAAGKPATRLMMYTNVYGPRNPDGTMSPSVPWTLSWIVSFSGSERLVVPPINFKGTLPDAPCQYVAVISALDGQQLDAYQVCLPAP